MSRPGFLILWEWHTGGSWRAEWCATAVQVAAWLEKNAEMTPRNTRVVRLGDAMACPEYVVRSESVHAERVI